MALVYSCCFWFSLRLGGIIIAFLSFLQTLILLILICEAHNNPQQLQEQITKLTDSKAKLIYYMKEILENIRLDPEMYTTYGITLTSVYMFLCLLYVYGAYKCNKIFMAGYILMELLRLILFSIILATLLLVLKQNTMDIGVLIGASVASGFFILGMFYLWVCAANLPILINEMEKEQHAATIANLHQLLAANNLKIVKNTLDDVPLPVQDNFHRRIIFNVADAYESSFRAPVNYSRNFVPGRVNLVG